MANGEERFAYDSEGCLSTHIAQEGQTTRYQHGAFDLLRGVIDPKGYGTQLEYDGAARLKQITNAQGQKWTYSYDLAGRLIHETDWAGRQTTYIRDAIGRVVTDHLGTPKELFDTNGNCVWQAEHELWGRTEVTFAKKADNYLPIVDCNLRFQNQWEDTETGLYYNLNRYYDPDSGQYLSSDPVGLEGGLRTHGYVHDPMQWVDPFGLAGCPVWDTKAGRWRDSQTGRFTQSPSAPQKVIGHYPEYVDLSKQLKVKPFSIPDKIWNKMSMSEQWAANQKFLDRAIAKGSEFNLATPIDKVRPGSYLQKEIQYL